MLKPSLTKIVLNWSILKDKGSFTGARDLILRRLSADIDAHSPLIAHLRDYTYQVATDKDIAVIHTDYAKGLYNIVYNQNLYKTFKDTDLYKRLEALRVMQITLKDICNNADIVRGEIRDAVIHGFERDILSYYMDGIASLPSYSIKLYPLPALDMNIKTILNLQGKDKNTQARNKKIQNNVRETLSLSTKEVINSVLEYFSELLRKYKNLDQLEHTASWINKYVAHNIESNFQERVDLKALLQYTPQDSTNTAKTSNFRILYKTYGNKLYEVKPIEERIFQLKEFIIHNLNLKEVTNDFLILQKFGLITDIFALQYMHQSKKTGFLEGVYYCGKETFEKILDALTDNMLWQALKMPYDRQKGISMLDHIMVESDTKLLLNWIAEKCSLKVLIKIANVVVRGENSCLLPIYHILNDPAFAQIVLKRLEEDGLLSEIEDLEGYRFTAYNNKELYNSLPEAEEAEATTLLEDKMTQLSFDEANFSDIITLTGAVGQE